MATDAMSMESLLALIGIPFWYQRYKSPKHALRQRGVLQQDNLNLTKNIYDTTPQEGMFGGNRVRSIYLDFQRTRLSQSAKFCTSCLAVSLSMLHNSRASSSLLAIP